MVVVVVVVCMARRRLARRVSPEEEGLSGQGCPKPRPGLESAEEKEGGGEG